MQIVLYFISTIIFCIASAYVAFRSQFSKKQIVYFSFTSVLVMGIAVMLSNFYTTNILIENVKRVCLLSMLAPIAYVDSKELRIPNKMIILGLIYRAIVIPIELFTYSGIRDSYIVSDIIAAALISVAAMLCRLVLHGGIGAGDIKLFVVMGLFLGLEGIWSSMFCTLIATFIVSVILLITKRKTKSDSIAFGPFLAIGTMLSVFLTGM